MLVYTILVSSSLFDSQNSKSAFLFSKNMMKYTNHSINSIFFYSNGIFNGVSLVNNKVNEISLVDCWYNFSKKFSINLYICYSAAQDRGMFFKSCKKKDECLNKNLHFGFKKVGLGKLIYSMLHSDRLLQF